MLSISITHTHSLARSLTLLQKTQIEKLSPPLPSLLIQPVQRVPRYRLLLQELIKATPETHSDYKPCKEALIQVEQVADYVNESIRQREQLEEIANIQACFIGKAPVCPSHRLRQLSFAFAYDTE